MIVVIFDAHLKGLMVDYKYIFHIDKLELISHHNISMPFDRFLTLIHKIIVYKF